MVSIIRNGHWRSWKVAGRWGSHIWVEGIGSESHGLFYPKIWPVDMSARLMCFSTKGRVGSPGSCALPISIADEKEPAPAVYPNPVIDYLYVETSLKGNYFYTLYAVSGQLLQSGELTGNSVDMTALQRGIYILTITGENGNSTYRVAK